MAIVRPLVAPGLTVHLIDTDVIWALRGSVRQDSDRPLFEWAADQIPETLFVSVVTVMEFENGARSLERKNKRSGAATRAWIETRFLPSFEGRIVPIDGKIAQVACRLGYGDFRDGILVATALQRGLVLATRTPAKFRVGKARTFNPWTYAADPDGLDWRRASQSAPLWLKSLFLRA